MSQFLDDWTPEKVALLAADERSAEAGFKLAIVKKWLSVGQDSSTAWGEFQGSGTKPYRVKIDLISLRNGDNRLGCTCPSVKRPCKHALALLFILAGTPEMIPYADTPDDVQQWRELGDQQRAKQQSKSQQASKQVDIDQQTKTFLERKRNIMAGLEELELWLDNMIRHGLGDPQLQNLEFWEAKAARMVDAQAPEIATLIREMGRIPQRTTPDWIEELLEQLGKLHLFIEGFKRFDDFSPAVQADLRAVAGWHLKRSDLADEDGYEDEWLVVGKYETDLDNRMRTQRIWLRGIHSGRTALIREFAYGGQAFGTNLQLGCLIRADLVFYPSAYPLRAFIRQQLAEPSDSRRVTGETIGESVEMYSVALSQNPWLPQFPFLLNSVIPMRYPTQWILRESDGVYVKIARNFEQRWSLLAVSGGHPIQVMGEWDGSEFLPTGAFAEGRFVDLNLIGKV